MKTYEKKKIRDKLLGLSILIVFVIILLCLIIVNFFIPVKYFLSYCVSSERAKEGVLRITYLNIGNGDSTIIELPDGKNMLIDGGNNTVQSKAEVIKWLNKRKIDKIDYLVCSSVMSNTCGGLAEILKYKKVSTVYMPYCTNEYITQEYSTFINEAKKSKTEYVISEYNIGEQGSDWFFKILSPLSPKDENSEYINLNSAKVTDIHKKNSSAVLWLEYLDYGFMFCGNVQKEILDKIASEYESAQGKYPVKLARCLAFKVPYMGGNTCLSTELFALLQPKISIISVADGLETYPSIDVLVALGKYGKVYATYEYGTTTIQITKKGYEVINRC